MTCTDRLSAVPEIVSDSMSQNERVTDYSVLIDGLRVSSLILYHLHYATWEIIHRETLPGFRERGYFSQVLAEMEKWMQSIACDTQEEQKLQLTVGQPAVYCYFFKRGYAPLAQDCDNAAILANPRMHWPRYVQRHGYCSYEKHHAPHLLTDKDPYCFPLHRCFFPWQRPDIYKHAVRVMLKKVIAPSF